MKELWEAREKPKPLQLARCLGDGRSADQNGAFDGAHRAATGESACKALGITGAHRVWSLAECATVDSSARLMRSRSAPCILSFVLLVCLDAAMLLALSAVS